MKKNFDLKKRMCAAALLLLLCGYGSAYAGTEKMPDVTSASPRQAGKTVTCVVSDEFGPVAGVNVVVKGTTNGNITDADGKVTLENLGSGAVLVVSFIGYVTQEIPVDGRKMISITLKEDAEELEEVVVVGYGTAKKKDLTGAISRVKAKEMEAEAPRSVQDLLRASAAGLSISMSTDAAGTADLQIRGKNTLSAGSSPLIVLDGVIYDGSLQDINAMDVESIDVLKDASSVAVMVLKQPTVSLPLRQRREIRVSRLSSLMRMWGWCILRVCPKRLTEQGS